MAFRIVGSVLHGTEPTADLERAADVPAAGSRGGDIQAKATRVVLANEASGPVLLTQTGPFSFPCSWGSGEPPSDLKS